MENSIKFRNMQLEISQHAIDRLRERFDYGVSIEDAVNRGKTLNMQNVAKWPWQRKSLMNNLSSSIKFIVNPYYNMKVVIDVATKVLITVEYLDASHTNYRYNY